MLLNKQALINYVKSMPDDTYFKLDVEYLETDSKYIQNLVIKTNYMVGNLDVVRV